MFERKNVTNIFSKLIRRKVVNITIRLPIFDPAYFVFYKIRKTHRSSKIWSSSLGFSGFFEGSVGQFCSEKKVVNNNIVAVAR